MLMRSRIKTDYTTEKCSRTGMRGRVGGIQYTGAVMDFWSCNKRESKYIDTWCGELVEPVTVNIPPNKTKQNNNKTKIKLANCCWWLYPGLCIRWTRTLSWNYNPGEDDFILPSVQEYSCIKGLKICFVFFLNRDVVDRSYIYIFQSS